MEEIRIAGLPEAFDLGIVRLQAPGKSQRIRHIIMAGKDARIVRERHQASDRFKKSAQVPGKAIADRRVEQRVAGDKIVPRVKAD